VVQISNRLTPKQQQFVAEYLVDSNATLAAIRAGYSRRTSQAQGSRLLTNLDVAAAIKGLLTRAQIDADWVQARLVENVERAMQAIPVLDRRGEPIGEYVYDGAVANSALALLAKRTGGFDHGNTGGRGSASMSLTDGDRSITFTLDIGRPDATQQLGAPWQAV
jgi:hypothetical protein